MAEIASVVLSKDMLFMSQNGLYSIHAGSLNESTPSYFITNNKTGIHEAMAQMLPDAFRMMTGLDEDLSRILNDPSTQNYLSGKVQ